MERQREENQYMPYSTYLTVNEFRGSNSNDYGAIEEPRRFNVTRLNWGRPIYVGFAFKRIWEEATAANPSITPGFRHGPEFDLCGKGAASHFSGAVRRMGLRGAGILDTHMGAF